MMYQPNESVNEFYTKCLNKGLKCLDDVVNAIRRKEIHPSEIISTIQSAGLDFPVSLLEPVKQGYYSEICTLPENKGLFDLLYTRKEIIAKQREISNKLKRLTDEKVDAQRVYTDARGNVDYTTEAQRLYVQLVQLSMERKALEGMYQTLSTQPTFYLNEKRLRFEANVN